MQTNLSELELSLVRRGIVREAKYLRHIQRMAPSHEEQVRLRVELAACQALIARLSACDVVTTTKTPMKG